MSSSNHSRWVSLVAAILVVLPVAIVLVVTWPNETPPISGNLERAALVVGFLLAALLGGALGLLFLALAETARGGPPSLETSWGGFGGGLGGWSLSPALTYLLAALFLGGLFGVLVDRVVESSAFHAWAGDTDAVAEGEEPVREIGASGGAEAEHEAGEPAEDDASDPTTPAPASES